MTETTTETRSYTAPRIVAAAVALVIDVLAPMAHAQSREEQSATSAARTNSQSLQEMEKAGVKIAFEVASVKENNSGEREHSNVPFAPGAPWPVNGGLFSASDFSLISYIAWAYDVPGDQAQHLLTQLPKWAITDPTDRFDIEARAQGNPTKPETQMMLQSLLTDRFKLAVHTDVQDHPVYALVLSKAGNTGPYLRAHTGDESCAGATSTKGAPLPPAGPSEKFPPACTTGIVAMQPTAPGRVRIGARNATMGTIASIFPFLGKAGVVMDRPVVDRTGLAGTFDFAIEFTPQIEGPSPSNADVKPDATGPTFLEALQDQLGLKLESTTGPVDVFVVDHIEEPSPN